MMESQAMVIMMINNARRGSESEDDLNLQMYNLGCIWGRKRRELLCRFQEHKY